MKTCAVLLMLPLLAACMPEDPALEMTPGELDVACSPDVSAASPDNPPICNE